MINLKKYERRTPKGVLFYIKFYFNKSNMKKDASISSPLFYKIQQCTVINFIDYLSMFSTRLKSSGSMKIVVI